jgi:hypothetical protein
MSIAILKHRFLVYELGLLSLKAALSTRDQSWPIYNAEKKSYQRSEAKSEFRAVLKEIKEKYSKNRVTESKHIEFIAEVARTLSQQLKSHLHNERFRIGVAQKLVNIHLKYLWITGLCPEPPHCPIDGIIRDLAKIDYDWTQSDSIDDYKCAINSLKKVAYPKTLSLWELEEFRRRDNKNF